MTKKGQPLTAMGRAKLRKLLGRGRARNWHLSRRNLRDSNRAQLVAQAVKEWREKPLAERQAWFEAEVGHVLGEMFDPKNVRRYLGPLTITVRRV